MCQLMDSAIYCQYCIFLRQKIIAEARSWIGTPFHHQGRIKQSCKPSFQGPKQFTGGLDCLGLIMCIAKNLELKNLCGKQLYELDENDYAFNIQSNVLYYKLVENLYELPNKAWQIADLLCFNIQGYAKHIAILSDTNKIIHVTQETNCVIEHYLDDYWTNKIHSAFRFNEFMQHIHKEKTL